MSESQFHTTLHDNGVAEVVLDRPPVNALNAAGWNALAAEIEARVVAAADKILAHTKPTDLGSKLHDVVAEDLGVTITTAPIVPARSAEPEVWETFTPTSSPGAREEARRPIPLERHAGAVGLGI